VRFAEDLLRDLGHALRQLKRSPRFAAMAISCLGVGIAINTAMFTMLNTVALRPLDGAQTERLVRVSRGRNTTFAYPEYREYRIRSRVFDGLAASLPMESDIEVEGTGEFVAAEAVSDNYADVFGIRPTLGRWFTNEVDAAAVISHAVWQRRFNGHPNVVGQEIRSESQVYTVVGVAPPEFTGVFAPLRTDIWVPLRTRPSLAAQLDDPAQRPLFMVFGRFGPEATPAQAAAELNAIVRQLDSEQRTSAPQVSPLVVEDVRGMQNPATRRAAQIVAALLSAVVGVVLLIAAVNVGNLLLARGAARRREWAIRRALGGTRFRIARQLLGESLVLALGGGLCGVIVAWWMNRLLERSLPRLAAGLDLQLNLALDWRVLLFAVLVTLATTLVCGLLPAWRSSRTHALVAMRSDMLTAGFRRRPWGVIGQVAMSLALLLVAGTFLQAAIRVQATDPGFAVSDRVYVQAFLPSSLAGDQTRAEYLRALERVRTMPGVRNAALSTFLPLLPARSDCAAAADGGSRIPITTGVVDAGFLEVLAVGLVSGRDFGRTDTSRAGPVVIVNERLAALLWPNREAVGLTVQIGCRETRPATVVGVIRNTAVGTVGEAPQPQLFQPFEQYYTGGVVTLIVHSGASAASLVEPLRRTLLDSIPGIRIYTVQPLSAHVARSYGPLRWQTALVTAFGILALLLAAFGLYGVIAYRVALRTPEIGVRMALGASQGDIFRDVIIRALGVVLIGVVVGEILVFALIRVLGSVQANIAPPAPLLYVVAGALWIAIGLIATYGPAARASRISPLVAFRGE
jgi:putative ABC transport system permease protein